MSNQPVFFLCVALSAFPLFAETLPAPATAPAASAPTPAAQQALSSSFALADSAKVIASLVSQASKASSPPDKKLILSALADYEERLGFFSDASKHYNEAAFADSAGRDDGFILDAARCALVSGDTEKAEGFVRAILLTSFSDPMLVRARVYSAWIQQAAGDSADAIPQIRSCAANSAFADFAPALLFTLWWSDNDSAAKARLLSDFSASPEASIVRGEMRLSPAPFWYLMVRNGTLVADFAREGSAALDNPVAVADSQPPASVTTPASVTAPAAVTTPGTIWQQTGFFKSRDNAEELKGKLEKLGFKPIIREDKRPSGTIYFSVLVPEDASRTTEKHLKDAGFESYLLID